MLDTAPTGVAVDGKGHIFAAVGMRLLKRAGGLVSKVAVGETMQRLDSDRLGNIYITQSGSPFTILALHTPSGKIYRAAPLFSAHPAAAAVIPDASALYVVFPTGASGCVERYAAALGSTPTFAANKTEAAPSAVPTLPPETPRTASPPLVTNTTAGGGAQPAPEMGLAPILLITLACIVTLAVLVAAAEYCYHREAKRKKRQKEEDTRLAAQRDADDKREEKGKTMLADKKDPAHLCLDMDDGDVQASENGGARQGKNTGLWQPFDRFDDDRSCSTEFYGERVFTPAHTKDDGHQKMPSICTDHPDDATHSTQQMCSVDDVPREVHGGAVHPTVATGGVVMDRIPSRDGHEQIIAPPPASAPTAPQTPSTVPIARESAPLQRPTPVHPQNANAPPSNAASLPQVPRVRRNRLPDVASPRRCEDTATGPPSGTDDGATMSDVKLQC
jgi:hypothetical protein